MCRGVPGIKPSTYAGRPPPATAGNAAVVDQCCCRRGIATAANQPFGPEQVVHLCRVQRILPRAVLPGEVFTPGREREIAHMLQVALMVRATRGREDGDPSAGVIRASSTVRRRNRNLVEIFIVGRSVR